MRQVKRFHLVTVLVFLLLLTAVAVRADYNLPSQHPRIFFTPDTIDEIADRCKEGGTHRVYYEKLRDFCNSRINAGKTKSVYLPNYALVYQIHKQWNLEGYDGGGFQEEYYWSFTRDALLSSSAWGIGSPGAEYSMATDWIFDKLSSSDINSLASKYGSLVTYVVDDDTWRDNTTFNATKYIFQSLVFAGSSADGSGDYTTEYQAWCGFIEDVFGPAMALMGGVGATGPNYETPLQMDRSWIFEAFTIATGINAWDIAGDWSRDWGKWIIYSKVPHRSLMEPNQDCAIEIYGDKYKNVGIMATRSQDPFCQTLTKKYWNAVLNNYGITAEKSSALWCLVLWMDTDLDGYDAQTAPNAVRLGPGGMEHIYMTTGLGNSDATWACFEAGMYFYGHQHQDAGAFTIHRKGDLLIDSGYYAQYNAENGGTHAINYYHRSIAHNTVSIYDPNEEFYWGASGTINGTIANDGGQVLPKSAPPYQMVLEDSTYYPGKIVTYETYDGYTYAKADLHNAYNQEAYRESRGLSPYPSKLSHITREFVFLRPDYFVVLDRIVSVNEEFTKVWNLHVTSDPAIEGSGTQRMGDAQAGIWDYPGASIAKITDDHPDYDQGSVFLKVLLPEDRIIRKIGGNNRSNAGYAYWVGGFDQNGKYDPTEGRNYYWGEWKTGKEWYETRLPMMTMGWGRIEVEATTPALDDIFLNVLYPCDASVNEMPDTRLIDTENMVGAEIVNERLILFGRSIDTGIDSVTYSVAPTDTSGVHMICNLVPATAYRVYRNGSTVYIRQSGMPSPDGADEIVSPPPTTTGAGILTFDFSGEVVASVEFSNISHTNTGGDPLRVTITWETNLAASSQVEYGPSPSMGFFSDLSSELVTSHSITLTEPQIENDINYYYRVHSVGGGGETGVSGNDSFLYDAGSPGAITDLRTID